jgi:outer membrane immunogenic protein
MQGIAVASVVGLSLFASASQAADMPVKAPPVVAPVFTWAGFYIGAHAGAVHSRTDIDPYTGPLFPAFLSGGVPLILVVGINDTLPGARDRDTSFIGGGQAGYNWQAGRYVFGVEVDVSGTGIENTAIASNTRFPGTTASQTVTTTYTTEVDWMASFRGRLGYAFDRVLVYATGGAAVAHVDVTASTTVTHGPAVIIPATPQTLIGSDSDTRWGWTVGGGLQWAVTDAWSIGAEYRHTDFRRHAATGALQIPDNTGGVFATASPGVRLTTDQVTARVNYKLGAR